MIRFSKWILLCFVCFSLLNIIESRRVRVHPQSVQQSEESDESPESELSDEDNYPQADVRYYSGESNGNIPQNRVLLVPNNQYKRLYTEPPTKGRSDYNRETISAIGSTPAPRNKEQAAKSPPVQTIRNYSKVNDDGSFTFGYEAADGSFKEETRGKDCVVRGKYGYIDPDGNKREFTYVSGNPCDPNNPEGKESDESSEEDSDEQENIPQNYPKRPIRPVRPAHTTTHAPTTIFQNTYSHHSLQEQDSDEEEPEPIQVLQPQKSRPQPVIQPVIQYREPPSEISIRQRPRITVSTTPSPILHYSSSQPVNITPRPTYRPPVQVVQTQAPPTTFRPNIKTVQRPVPITYSKPSSRPAGFTPSTPNSIPSSRRPIDFQAEFEKFQKEHNLPITTTARTTTSFRPIKTLVPQSVAVPTTSNPIYESQLIFDPSSGQYDSALYQQLPQTDGDFQLNHRIQPYVHAVPSQAPQLVSLEQLHHLNPIYRKAPAAIPNQMHLSQQIYEKERENLQVLNSQQLFQHQQELQKQQLQQDRLEAARKASAREQQSQHEQTHKFQPSIQAPIPPQAQGFYYIQPSSGQIDAFLRGHSIGF